MRLIDNIKEIVKALPQGSTRYLSITGLVALFSLVVISTFIFLSSNDHISVSDELASLTYVKVDGSVGVIEVEVADTDQKRTTGLMNITYLPKDSGMLFIFPEMYVPTMWMKDTYIPLDMLFLDEDLKIIHIARNTVPNQTTEIYSAGAAGKYVLEMNGGWSQREGIEIGDQFVFDSEYK
jgi:uncharacterized membrane protein (UPF0127 family)